MPRSAEYAKVELDADEQPAPMLTVDSDTPFRILLLGDFSGRASRGAADAKLKGRRPMLVDRDNFDQVLERLEVELPSIRFAELDDFHPDRLYEQLPVFRTLRGTRERLSDRATFPAAAAELREWAPAPPRPSEKPAPPPELNGLTPDELLARMLDDSPEAIVPSRAADPFERLLHEIVAPHLEPKPDPQQAELVAQVDETIGGQMRAILHHPDFQSLEAAWRGLFFLVRRLETSADLKLYILDVSKEELAAVTAADDLSDTALYRVIVEQTVGTPGAEPWAVVAGNYTFSGAPDDLLVLRALGRMCRAAGAPFLAGASPAIVGCDTLEGSPDPRTWEPDPRAGLLWKAFRQTPEATWIGLALPRFLLRLPYGESTSSTENFDFEEFPGTPEHEGYLWGNPALACLYLMGEGFSEYGWQFRPDQYHEIDGLPVHLYKQDGESVLKPCAEALLTERAAQAIMEKGLMVLASLKDSDRVRLLRFQSLADPPAALEGRWQ
jgi:type VI secretion system protein ImpC